MAKAKAGSLVYAIRGRVGNEVYSIWKGQQIVRALGFKAWNPSAKQTALVDLLAEATVAWNALTQTERDAWDVQAGKQKRRPNNSRPRGGVRNLVPENQSLGSGRMIFIGRYMNAKRHGWNPAVVWALNKEDFANLVAWATGGGAPAPDIAPAGFLHMHPNAANNVDISQTVGGWATQQYTSYFHTNFTALSTVADVTHYRQYIYDGQHRNVFDIHSDKVGYYNGAAWEYIALATALATDYWWWIRYNSSGDSIKVWRSTDNLTWSYIGEFTTLRNDVANQGDIKIQAIRGGAPDMEFTQDFWYLVDGLYEPPSTFSLPGFYRLIQAPTITSVVYNLEICRVTFTLPPDFYAPFFRVGIWCYGGYTALGEIYRQWVDYQPNSAVLTIDFTHVYVTGNGLQALVDLEDTFLYVQAYICSAPGGHMSAGSNTVEVEIK